MIIFNAGHQSLMASSTIWAHDRYAFPGRLIDGWSHVTSCGQGIMTRGDVCHFQTRGAFNLWSKSLPSWTASSSIWGGNLSVTVNRLSRVDLQSCNPYVTWSRNKHIYFQATEIWMLFVSEAECLLSWLITAQWLSALVTHWTHQGSLEQMWISMLHCNSAGIESIGLSPGHRYFLSWVLMIKKNPLK